MSVTVPDDVQITFSWMQCGECDVYFCLEERFRKRRLEDHRTFFCPNGHGRVYNGATEADKLKHELEQQKKVSESNRVRADNNWTRYLAMERSANAYKGKVTSLKKRVSNGICPVCKRTFSQVARHMHHKHPEYGEKD